MPHYDNSFCDPFANRQQIRMTDAHIVRFLVIGVQSPALLPGASYYVKFKRGDVTGTSVEAVAGIGGIVTFVPPAQAQAVIHFKRDKSAANGLAAKLITFVLVNATRGKEVGEYHLNVSRAMTGVSLGASANSAASGYSIAGATASGESSSPIGASTGCSPVCNRQSCAFRMQGIDSTMLLSFVVVPAGMAVPTLSTTESRVMSVQEYWSQQNGSGGGGASTDGSIATAAGRMTLRNAGASPQQPPPPRSALRPADRPRPLENEMEGQPHRPRVTISLPSGGGGLGPPQGTTSPVAPPPAQSVSSPRSQALEERDLRAHLAQLDREIKDIENLTETKRRRMYSMHQEAISAFAECNTKSRDYVDVVALTVPAVRYAWLFRSLRCQVLPAEAIDARVSALEMEHAKLQTTKGSLLSLAQDGLNDDDVDDHAHHLHTADHHSDDDDDSSDDRGSGPLPATAATAGGRLGAILAQLDATDAELKQIELDLDGLRQRQRQQPTTVSSSSSSTNAPKITNVAASASGGGAATTSEEIDWIGSRLETDQKTRRLREALSNASHRLATDAASRQWSSTSSLFLDAVASVVRDPCPESHKAAAAPSVAHDSNVGRVAGAGTPSITSSSSAAATADKKENKPSFSLDAVFDIPPPMPAGKDKAAGGGELRQPHEKIPIAAIDAMFDFPPPPPSTGPRPSSASRGSQETSQATSRSDTPTVGGIGPSPIIAAAPQADIKSLLQAAPKPTAAAATAAPVASTAAPSAVAGTTNRAAAPPSWAPPPNFLAAMEKFSTEGLHPPAEATATAAPSSSSSIRSKDASLQRPSMDDLFRDDDVAAPSPPQSSRRGEGGYPSGVPPPSSVDGRLHKAPISAPHDDDRATRPKDDLFADDDDDDDGVGSSAAAPQHPPPPVADLFADTSATTSSNAAVPNHQDASSGTTAKSGTAAAAMFPHSIPPLMNRSLERQDSSSLDFIPKTLTADPTPKLFSTSSVAPPVSDGHLSPPSRATVAFAAAPPPVVEEWPPQDHATQLAVSKLAATHVNTSVCHPPSSSAPSVPSPQAAMPPPQRAAPVLPATVVVNNTAAAPPVVVVRVAATAIPVVDLFADDDDDDDDDTEEDRHAAVPAAAAAVVTPPPSDAAAPADDEPRVHHDHPDLDAEPLPPSELETSNGTAPAAEPSQDHLGDVAPSGDQCAAVRPADEYEANTSHAEPVLLPASDRPAAAPTVFSPSEILGDSPRGDEIAGGGDRSNLAEAEVGPEQEGGPGRREQQYMFSSFSPSQPLNEEPPSTGLLPVPRESRRIAVAGSSMGGGPPSVVVTSSGRGSPLAFPSEARRSGGSAVAAPPDLGNAAGHPHPLPSTTVPIRESNPHTMTNTARFAGLFADAPLRHALPTADSQGGVLLGQPPLEEQAPSRVHVAAAEVAAGPSRRNAPPLHVDAATIPLAKRTPRGDDAVGKRASVAEGTSAVPVDLFAQLQAYTAETPPVLFAVQPDHSSAQSQPPASAVPGHERDLFATDDISGHVAAVAAAPIAVDLFADDSAEGSPMIPTSAAAAAAAPAAPPTEIVPVARTATVPPASSVCIPVPDSFRVRETGGSGRADASGSVGFQTIRGGHGTVVAGALQRNEVELEESNERSSLHIQHDRQLEGLVAAEGSARARLAVATAALSSSSVPPARVTPTADSHVVVQPMDAAAPPHTAAVVAAATRHDDEEDAC